MTTSVPLVDYTDTVRRPTWTDLPDGVRRAVAEIAGAPVASVAAPPRSGFSGGFAAALELQNGHHVFAKAGSSVDPHLVGAYAQEAVVLAALPDGVPAPTLVGSTNLQPGDADDHEWQIVVASAVQGRLPEPWTEIDIAAAHDGCLAAVQALTPPPLVLRLPSLNAQVALAPDTVTCFDRLADGTLAVPEGQPSWLLSRCPELSELVAGAAPSLAGATACHGDLRADNMLIGAHHPPWPNGSPLIRQHQRRYARTFLDWLDVRRRWGPR